MKGEDKTVIAAKDISSFSARDRILAAALKLFVEQGYFNTNVPDLSRESKCSVGSIYHNFRNKEEVAAALYQEGINSFRRALQEALVKVEEPSEVVKTVIKSFLEFSEVNHQFSRYLWLSRHNEFMTGVIKSPTMVGYDMLGRKLTKSIKKGIREGKILPLKANIIWTIMFGIPLSYIRDWLDGYNPDAPRKVADQIAEACWRSLRA